MFHERKLKSKNEDYKPSTVVHPVNDFSLVSCYTDVIYSKVVCVCKINPHVVVWFWPALTGVFLLGIHLFSA